MIILIIDNIMAFLQMKEEAKIQSSLDVWLYSAEFDCFAAAAADGYTTSGFIDKIYACATMLLSTRHSMLQYNKYLRKN